MMCTCVHVCVYDVYMCVGGWVGGWVLPCIVTIARWWSGNEVWE